MVKAKKKTATGKGVLQTSYEQLVATGKIKDDAAQHQVLIGLEALYAQLAASEGGNPLTRLFSRPDAPMSLYIWGNVGRGKSMLMDLFYQHAPVKKKRRAHFHAFMQEVYSRIHQLRQLTRSEKGSADPVALLVRELAAETTLLCFDELQATDVADATLLYRLFQGLFDAGVVIVSTSNRPPGNIYTGGVQRERFAKFIALIEEKMHVMALSSPLDYRHVQIQSLQQCYFSPLGPQADAFIEDVIERICTDTRATSETLNIKGHTLSYMLYDGSIGRSTFHDLCEKPLGPADYLALADRLDTLILTDIPQFSPEKRNEVKRFTTLIDALYEHKVTLIATAAAPANALYTQGGGAFEFQRTVSRLAEMQSAKYLEGKQ